MPATIERVIRDQSQRYGQVRVGRATSYLQVDDPEVLDEIVSNGKLKGMTIEVIAPSVAVVHGTDDAGAIAALRKAGYLPIPKLSSPASGSSPATLPRLMSQDEIKIILRYSASDRRLARIRWTDPQVGEIETVFEPQRLGRSDVKGFDAETGDELEIPVQWISSAVQLSVGEARKYYEE
jgi:hypothetical protein